MAATTITSTEERLATTPLVHNVLLTNGVERVSLQLATGPEDRFSLHTLGITLTADEAEDLAAALIAKASNVRNGIHDNDFGAR